MTAVLAAAPAHSRRRLDWPARLAVLAPALLSLALSLVTVGRRDLWRDELATWQFSRLSFLDLGRAAHHVDAVLLPYYALMHVWQWLFPQAVALRVPSLLAAAATVAVVAATGARLWNGWAGAAAGLTLALNGSFAATAVEARPYALATLACAAATYLLVRTRSEPTSRRLWMGYALTAALAVLLQPFSAFLLAAHMVVAIVWFGRVSAARWRFVAAAAAPAIAAVTVAVVSAGQHGQLFWVQPQSIGAATDTVIAATGQLEPWHGWLLVGAAAVSAAVAIRARDTGWLLGPCLLVAPAGCLFVLSGVWHPAFVLRYLVIAPIGGALIIGASVNALHKTWLAAAGVAALAAVVLIAAQPSLATAFSRRSADDFPGQVARITQSASPADWVVVGQDYASGGIAAGLAYYSHDRAFEAAILASLPGGSPRLFVRPPADTASATEGGIPHGRTWLISLVRWWAGEAYPYGYHQLEHLGCVRDTGTALTHTHGYGLMLLRCP